MELDVTAIRVFMALRGIKTQRELSTRLGLSDNATSELLLGKRQPTLDTVGALCRVLDCTPNDVLVYDPKAVALVTASAA